ncbi:MAG: DoxX family membrane protein [Haliscomenobacteraceae bacterium CHB4]|nr:DoxX family membrane protein [Haliscomenobacteraceae bacterium CHB4]
MDGGRWTVDGLFPKSKVQVRSFKKWIVLHLPGLIENIFHTKYLLTMNAFLSLGRWLFPVPFLVFGLFHFMNAQLMADSVVPAYMPAKIVWVFLSGGCLIAAALSMYLGKYDKLAAALLAVFLLFLVLLVDLPGAISGGEAAQNSVSMLFKDLGLAAAAMLYAVHVAKDRSVVG